MRLAMEVVEVIARLAFYACVVVTLVRWDDYSPWIRYAWVGAMIVVVANDVIWKWKHGRRPEQA